MTRWLRFASIVRRETRSIVVLLCVAAVGVALEALLPWPLKLIIDHVLSGEPLPAATRWIAALPGANASSGMLAWLALAVVLLFALLQALQVAKGVLQAQVAARLRFALGAQVFERLQSLALTYHRRARKGDLLRRVTSDSGCVGTLVTDVLVPVFISAVSLTVLFLIMWQLDWALALLAAAVALPMGALIRLLGTRMTVRAYAQQEAEGAVWSTAEQSLTAIPVVQGFGRELHEESRFMSTADRSVRAYMRTLVSQIQFRIGIDACEALGVAAIMLVGGYHVLSGQASIGTLVVFLSYVAVLYAPLTALAYVAMTVAGAAGSARRVEEVLDAGDEIVEARRASPLRAAAAGARAHVSFEAVVFGYEPGVPVLRDVELEVASGEMLALVGATGAGKSTLVSLIPRLFDPWRGRVFINGQDVRVATLASVRDSVAFVLQDSFLLPISIADNIAYARPSATRAEIKAAARLAEAEEFVARLPQGFDTVIGERGVTLSGGQRQRLAIARALLKNAPILIMDEPTSALDVATEASVLAALSRLAEGRTTIVIAHRLSTVRRADRIVLMSQGEIAAVGTHEQLAATDGLYRMLCLSQLVPEHAATTGRPSRDL